MRFVTLITATIFVLVFASQSISAQPVQYSHQGSSELSKRETIGSELSGIGLQKVAQVGGDVDNILGDYDKYVYDYSDIPHLKLIVFTAKKL
jgi:hypothetical protein